MTNCINCKHPKAAHNQAGKCRLGGCSCPGFDDGTPKPKRPVSRRVAIDVPDGYTLSISLIPWDPNAEVVDVTHEVSSSATVEEAVPRAPLWPATDG